MRSLSLGLVIDIEDHGSEKEERRRSANLLGYARNRAATTQELLCCNPIHGPRMALVGAFAGKVYHKIFYEGP